MQGRKPEKNSYTIFMYRDFIPPKIVGKATPLQLVYSIDSLQVTLLKSNGPTTLTIIHNLMVSKERVEGHFLHIGSNNGHPLHLICAPLSF